MLVKTTDSIDGVGLRLSTQTAPGFEMKDALWRAAVWAPKKAKSFTISHFRFTNYHGMPIRESIGYSSFYVLYYSTVKEGEHLIEQHKDRTTLDAELFAAQVANGNIVLPA